VTVCRPAGGASAVPTRPDRGRDHEPPDRASACSGSTPPAARFLMPKGAHGHGFHHTLISLLPLSRDLRGHWSAGRWRRDSLQAEGRGFESRQLHKPAGQRSFGSRLGAEVSPSSGLAEPPAAPPHPNLGVPRLLPATSCAPISTPRTQRCPSTRRNRRSAPPCSSSLRTWSGRPGDPTHRASAGRCDRHGSPVAPWRWAARARSGPAVAEDSIRPGVGDEHGIAGVGRVSRLITAAISASAISTAGASGRAGAGWATGGAASLWHIPVPAAQRCRTGTLRQRHDLCA